MVPMKFLFLSCILLTSTCLFCAATKIDVNVNEGAKQLGAASVTVPIVPADEPEKTTSTTPPPKSSSTSSSSTSTSTTSTTPKTDPTTSTPAPTTAAPTTTSEEPKTTTPAPAPYPEPSIGRWNSSCIMIQMATQLNFTYETKDNKTARTLYNIPADAVVEDSHCEAENNQFIQINWGPSKAQHVMLLQFDKKNTSVELALMTFTLPLVSDRFPDAKENQSIQLIHRGHDFNAPLKMSYHCTRAQTLNLTELVSNNEIIGTATIRDVQVEAFRKANGTSDFSSAHDCDSSATADVVPIAVGIALAALISVVLISYLCARRRSTARGYMSF